MLRRLQADFEQQELFSEEELLGGVTQEELRALERHINENKNSTHTVNMLRSLSQKLKTHYEGDLYRGVAIPFGDSLSFLQNKAFTTWGEDRIKGQGLESWSTDASEAAKFAIEGIQRINYFGVVLKSHTSKKDVLFYFDMITAQEIQEIVRQNGWKFEGLRYSKEEEVMVLAESNRQYDICSEEVIEVVVDISGVVSNDTLFEEFSKHLYEVDLPYMQEFKEQLENEIDVRELEQTYHEYHCDDQGKLKFMAEEYFVGENEMDYDPDEPDWGENF